MFHLLRLLIACVLFNLDVCFAFFAQCGCELKLFYDLGMLLFAVKFIYFLNVYLTDSGFFILICDYLDVNDHTLEVGLPCRSQL